MLMVKTHDTRTWRVKSLQTWSSVACRSRETRCLRRSVSFADHHCIGSIKCAASVAHVTRAARRQCVLTINRPSVRRRQCPAEQAKEHGMYSHSGLQAAWRTKTPRQAHTLKCTIQVGFRSCACGFLPTLSVLQKAVGLHLGDKQGMFPVPES